jgi:hypothetical protein
MICDGHVQVVNERLTILISLHLLIVFRGLRHFYRMPRGKTSVVRRKYIES